MTRTVIENATVATVDALDSEFTSGHVVIEGNRIAAVGDGPAPEHLRAGSTIVDGTGHLLTPGLVNPTSTCTSG